MVLDLHVQPSCQEEHKVVVGGDIVGRDDLVLEEVLVELLGVVRGQVIDLAGYHEAYREEVDWQYGEQEASQGKSVQYEWDNVDHENIEDKSELEGICVQMLIGSEVDYFVV